MSSKYIQYLCAKREIEKTDEGSKAEITTTKWVDGEAVEEVQVIEGTHEEVMKKVASLTAESEGNEIVIRKTKKKLQFNLNPKSDTQTAGEVLFTEEEGKVTLQATISGLTEGTHAIHIHEKADCSSPGSVWLKSWIPVASSRFSIRGRTVCFFNRPVVFGM